MGLFNDVLNGKEPTVSEEIRNLSDRELKEIYRNNPYGWSIVKMAQVATEIKRRGLDRL